MVDAQVVDKKGSGKSQAGNIYVLAVDQGSYRPVNAPSVTYAVREFLKRVTPADYVGMISFPAPGVRLDPTRDRKALDDASLHAPPEHGFSRCVLT